METITLIACAVAQIIGWMYSAYFYKVSGLKCPMSAAKIVLWNALVIVGWLFAVLYLKWYWMLTISSILSIGTYVWSYIWIRKNKLYVDMTNSINEIINSK